MNLVNPVAYECRFRYIGLRPFLRACALIDYCTVDLRKCSLVPRPHPFSSSWGVGSGHETNGNGVSRVRVSFTSELRLVVWNAIFGRMGAAEVSESAGWAIDPRVVRNGSTITRELYAVWKNRKWLLTSPSLECFLRLKFTRTVSRTVFRFSSQERLPSLMGWRQVILTIQHYHWFWRCSFNCSCQKHIYTLYII